MPTVATHWTRDSSKLLLVMALAPQDVGRRIKAARERKGWTQLEFALQANISPSSVARWEGGKLPPVRELFRIAELLGVSVDELVEAAPVEDDRLERLENRVSAGFEQIAETLELILARLDEQGESLRRRA